MPTDDPTVPPPRRRPLGRGGASPVCGDTSPCEPAPDPPPEGPASVAPGDSGGTRRGSGPGVAARRPHADPGRTAPHAADRAAAHRVGGTDGRRQEGRTSEQQEQVPSESREPGGGAPSAGESRDAAGACPPSGHAVPGDAGGPGAAPQGTTGGTDDRAAPQQSPRAAAPPRAIVPVARSGDAAAEEPAVEDGRFTVVLDNFEGPFDLLLQLISKHKMDVTEVALSRVTDEFMAHIRAMGPDWDLDQTTEFLVVAATLLDLKAARLLPAAEVEDEADLALLEARDLLFARLLQYRAYKRVADIFADRLAAESHRRPRTVGLEPHHAELLPEVVLSIGPQGFAKLAVQAMQPKPKPQVYVDHIHAPLVSVREQAEIVVARLRALGEADFAALTEDAADTLTVVARFLALLELYRESAVALDQQDPLGTLTVRWCGADGEGTDPRITDEFDPESAAAQPKEGATP